MKKLSIIIPVYNVEQYVERCIQSIVTQNIPHTEYELIVVNDGSTDKSREILTELQGQYPFIIIADKENGGLSSARNEGMKHATGEYIFFIDSDDWISNDSLPFLFDWSDKYPEDILIFGSCESDGTTNGNFLTSNLSPNNQTMPTEYYLTSYTLRSSAWQGIFRRSLFEKINYQFKHGFVSEDDDFVVRIFSVAKNIVCNNKTVYFYFQRGNSISKSLNKKATVKLINDKLIMQHELDEYIHNFDGKLRLGLQRKMDFLAVDMIRLLMRKNHSSKTINTVLSELNSLGYFPLRKPDYTLKYKLFRLFFSRIWIIRLGRILKKYI